MVNSKVKKTGVFFRVIVPEFIYKIREYMIQYKKMEALTYLEKYYYKTDGGDNNQMSTIYWAADSTVQYNSILTYPQTGIGQMMHLFLKPEVAVQNHAINGRSTKSFIEQGRLAVIEELLQPEDYLFIQFGHNDEKKDDPLRYTEPYGEYSDNLEIYVNTARQKKAYPVLITPIERRRFDQDGNLGPGEHGEYVCAMKQVAEKLNVPLIDLYTRSRELLTKLGPEGAKKIYISVGPDIYPNFPDGKEDLTHLCVRGAICYASYIAEGLRDLGGKYAELVLDLKTVEQVRKESANQ